MVHATVEPAIWFKLDRDLQCLQHSVHVIHHVRIVEPDHDKPSLPFKPRVSCPVTKKVMRVAIHLNAQALRGAKKVKDTHPDHDLASEFVVVKTAIAQFHPQATFWLGWIAAHFCGAMEQKFARGATTPNPLL